MPIPFVTKETLLHGGRFIRFKELEWVDAGGAGRTWETADRFVPGAVIVIAWLKPSDRIILIRQFRPPANRFVYEFPAGLMDDGETPEEAARRELREETGYVASSMRIFPPAYCTPGLSNESVYIAAAEIDESAPENVRPETEFDAEESIETFLVNRSGLGEFHRRETEAGAAFDAKLAGYILAKSL